MDAPMQTETRQAEPLSLRATLRPESVNPETRTVDLVFSTGARVRRVSWIDGPFFEELSLDPAHVRLQRLNNGAPLLDAHNSYDLNGVLGVVQSAALKDGVLSGTVRFARAEDDEDAEKAFRKVKDGIIRNVSIGYRAHKMQKVTGGDAEIPVFRVTDWEPYEVSLVPMGADDGAKVRSDCATNQCQVITPGETEEGTRMADDTKPPETPAPAETPPPAAPTPDPAAASARSGITLVETPADPAVERERADQILAACEAANLPVAFARALINDQVPIVTAQRKIIDELMVRGQDGKGPGAGPSGAPVVAGAQSAGTQLHALTLARAAEKKILYGAAFAEIQTAHRALASQYAKGLTGK